MTIGRLTLVVAMLGGGAVMARAQDVPGIEICTVEKTMERRTSCLQSNVDFLMKTIGKLTADHQRKLDGAARQIEALQLAVAAQQKIIDELKATQAKLASGKDPASKDASSKDGPAKEPSAVKETGK